MGKKCRNVTLECQVWSSEERSVTLWQTMVIIPPIQCMYRKNWAFYLEVQVLFAAEMRVKR